MKTAEEKISGDSARLDLSSEGLGRECEMARRRVMAHVHDFIYRMGVKAHSSLFSVGGMKATLYIKC